MRRFIMMVLLLPGCVQDLTLGRSGLRPLDESSPVAASALLPASPPSRILTLAGLPEVHTGIVVIPADVVHVARAGQTDQSLSAPTVSTETSKTVTLQFDSNQTQPRRESLLILTRVIEQVGAEKIGQVVVAGHADSSGNKEKNFQLSLQRAEAVAVRIAELGVPRQKILVHGYGEMSPAANNASGQGRAVNRRVQVTMTIHGGNQ